MVDLKTALKAASDEGLDLVEIVPDAKPPVAKIMDYKRYLYDQKQKQKKPKRTKSKPKLKKSNFALVQKKLTIKLNFAKSLSSWKTRIKLKFLSVSADVRWYTKRSVKHSLSASFRTLKRSPVLNKHQKSKVVKWACY